MYIILFGILWGYIQIQYGTHSALLIEQHLLRRGPSQEQFGQPSVLTALSGEKSVEVTSPALPSDQHIWLLQTETVLGLHVQ